MSNNRRALIAGLATTLLAPRRARAASVTDGAGRAVPVPARVERVFPAGPPAAIFLYTLAPELLIGWPRANRPEEREFLLPDIGGRPEVGASADVCDPESCSANVHFEPHSASPTPKPTLMAHAMGNVPFRPVATGSTSHEAPRAVIRHCHGCYSPLACRVTHRKCVSVPS